MGPIKKVLRDLALEAGAEVRQIPMCTCKMVWQIVQDLLVVHDYGSYLQDCPECDPAREAERVAEASTRRLYFNFPLSDFAD